MATEIQSVSPTGRYQVVSEPWEPRMSLWVYPPQIVDTHSGVTLFKTEDINWSLEYSKWLNDSVVRIGLRKYPGGIRPGGLVVEVDCSGNRATIDTDLSVTLDELPNALERVLALANQFGEQR